jgi:hypothetical protein
MRPGANVIKLFTAVIYGFSLRKSVNYRQKSFITLGPALAQNLSDLNQSIIRLKVLVRDKHSLAYLSV